MTNDQLRMLAIARRQAERHTGGAFDEAQYRLLLRNVGRVKPDGAGHVTAKGLSNAGLDSVMAYLEEHCGYRQSGKPANYWRDGAAATLRRQVHLIRGLAAASSYPLAGLVRRFSGDRTDDVERLTPAEASDLIEMLKDSNRRAAGKGKEAARGL